MTKVALNPAHPERVCWGCEQYCRADDLACGNGTERTQHPIELFGSDWLEWARDQGGYDDVDPSAERTPRHCSRNPNARVDVGSGDELEARALEALRTVLDPELGVNIVDLGLVYRVHTSDQDRLAVDLTMTSPACPLGESIVSEAEERLRELEGVPGAEVRLVWDPPWDPARMSERARSILGWTG